TNRPIHSDGGNPTRLGLGFPIRTPTDQSSVDSSPRPIAASHVLHRRLVPRHPPYATITWPPQIQDARAHYPRIKTPATNPPTTPAPHQHTHPKTRRESQKPEKQGLRPGWHPETTNGCSLRHPTARPQALPETQGKVQSSRPSRPQEPAPEGAAPASGPLSSPPADTGKRPTIKDSLERR